MGKLPQESLAVKGICQRFAVFVICWVLEFQQACSLNRVGAKKQIANFDGWSHKSAIFGDRGWAARVWVIVSVVWALQLLHFRRVVSQEQRWYSWVFICCFVVVHGVDSGGAKGSSFA